ncbi:MAG: pseudouridine synthase [Candidatus Babeliales bacterium]
MHLNHYIAQAGICSRRKAVDLIKEKKISVNNQIITNPSYQVKENDIVKYQKKVISAQQNVYILLNKPKGYVSTTSDELGRKTIFDLIGSTTAKRLYPVGRLDKDTTGLIIITNDGQLTQKLAHPKFEIQKTYLATLDKPLSHEDFQRIRQGIKLVDGFIRVDSIAYANIKNKKKVKVKLHSGKKRVIRRIFQLLDYQVTELDRVQFAGLTKKNLKKGSWRYLTAEEVKQLNKFNE